MASLIADSYERKARLSPAVLAILPGFVAVVTWFPYLAAGWELLGRMVVSAVVGFAVAVMLAELARSSGRQKQTKLWAQWGGAPTTDLLRHRNSDLTSHTRRRYHEALSRKIGLAMPTREEEALDPARADKSYASGVDFLRSHTRDATRFPLVAAENASYGFRRNLWGLKPLGIILSAASAAAMFGLLTWRWHSRALLDIPTIVSVMVELATLVTWVAIVTPDWVRVAAQGYAMALLETCESLAD